jgi:hypothetical protein
MDQRLISSKFSALDSSVQFEVIMLFLKAGFSSMLGQAFVIDRVCFACYLLQSGSQDSTP